MMQSLCGVVLCGGESRRMGRDKGSLQIGQTVWALHMTGKLDFLQIPVFYSVNERQLAAYSSFIPPDRLIVDTESVRGPLKGLLSAHRALPGLDLLLLACDMLDLDRQTLERLVNAYNGDASRVGNHHEAGYRGGREFDFFVFQDGQRAQPLCGIYTSQGLTQISDSPGEQAKGDGKEPTNAAGPGGPDYSLQSILKRGRTQLLEMTGAAAFRNYNSPEQ
ncbi:MAG: molybdenum cofactor guanylyltransferase [Puia sp.]|nr:molybdenum cofactor guanylyltransferase [Puia sp.]